MNKSDIRYGNIVKVDNKKYHPNLKEKPLIVVGFSMNQDEFCVQLESPIHKENITKPLYSQFLKYIKGVYLNEYVLLKCGFKKQYVSNTYILKDVFIVEFNDNKFLVRNYINNSLIAPIKYLHQLQNLYYDYEGIDLKIEL